SYHRPFGHVTAGSAMAGGKPEDSGGKLEDSGGKPEDSGGKPEDSGGDPNDSEEGEAGDSCG
ncbi:hypothetical protein FRB90_010484, partial [Tulasnella sp. 427]